MKRRTCNEVRKYATPSLALAYRTLKDREELSYQFQPGCNATTDICTALIDRPIRKPTYYNKCSPPNGTSLKQFSHFTGPSNRTDVSRRYLFLRSCFGCRCFRIRSSFLLIHHYQNVSFDWVIRPFFLSLHAQCLGCCSIQQE